MSDFFSMVQKLNAISQNEEVAVTPSPETTTKRKEIAETATLLNKFNAISAENPYQPVVVEAEEAEVDETMQDRFAKFLAAERTAGSDFNSMKSVIDEGTAEYEYAQRAFDKMLATLEMMEKMTAEGGMLERKIAQAGGDTASLDEAREALLTAYADIEDAKMIALGGTPEQQPEE